jgi:hypothetical protein
MAGVSREDAEPRRGAKAGDGHENHQKAQKERQGIQELGASRKAVFLGAVFRKWILKHGAFLLLIRLKLRVRFIVLWLPWGS